MQRPEHNAMQDGLVRTRIVEISTARSRIYAVSGIILSSTIMAIASGMLFSYIPIKLLGLGFEPWVPAAMTPALALGGLVGCLATGPLLRLSGHARIFMLLYALITMSMATIAFFENPYAWVFARMGYGFAISGVFIVAQSWLHFAVTDDVRGRVISIFYVSYVVALGFGSFSTGYLDVSGQQVPVIATFFVALAMVPVSITKLPQPEAPDTISVDLRRVWQISPVGLAGMFAVGGMTMIMQSISPIYASEIGASPQQVGLLLLLMQIGLISIQVPMGVLSDRIDRRIVLLLVASGSVVVSIVAFMSHDAISGTALGAMGFGFLIVLFAVWNGFNETIYSVSSALANDRADPADYVMLSSTQMIAWSVSAFVLPLGATICLYFLPVQSYMLICAALGVIFIAFLIYRMRARKEVPPDERETFQTMTAQVVYPGDYSNPDAYEDSDGVTEGLR